jgi:hypothetical protein
MYSKFQFCEMQVQTAYNKNVIKWLDKQQTYNRYLTFDNIHKYLRFPKLINVFENVKNIILNIS